jgi:serine/threonine protein kinase
VEKKEDAQSTAFEDTESAESTLPVSALASPSPLHPVNSMIAGHYRVVSKLGAGGMGTVYKCEHTYLKRTVAVKVLNNCILEDNSAVKRFSQEAQAAATFSHPGIPAVREFGVDEKGFPFLVMDFVDGELLSRCMRSSKLSVQEACQMAIEICDALQHAHDKKIVHRDIKPSNIMLAHDENEGGAPRAVLLDFGVAKVIDAVHDVNLTETGELLGTITYMSPEQAQGLALDQRADIYALGCTLYEVVSGGPPFTGSNRIEVIMKHQQAEPPDLPADVPIGLQHIIFRCLEKQPAKRFQTAEELKNEVDAFLHGKKKKPLFPRLKTKWKKSFSVAMFGLPAMAVFSALLWMALHPVNELEELNSEVHSHPDEAQPYFKRAMYYFNSGRRKVAISDLEKAVSLEPKKAKYTYWLARCYTDMWNAEDGLKACNKTIGLDPKFAAVYVTRAYAEAEMGKYDAALQDCHKALAITDDTNDSKAAALTSRSMAEHMLGLNNQAKADAEAAGRMAPADLDAKVALVDALNGLGQFEAASNLCDQIMSTTAKSSRLTISKLPSEIGLGKIQQALADVQDTASGSTNKIRPLPLLLRAKIYLQKGEPKNAIADCESVLKQQPGNPVPFFYKAKAQLELKEYAKALASVDKAISLQTKYADAYLLRAILSAKNNDAASAHSAFEAAQKSEMVALSDLGLAQDSSVAPREPALLEQAKASLRI